jgi:tetratricopeptide (TPR) repeat protein
MMSGADHEFSFDIRGSLSLAELERLADDAIAKLRASGGYTDLDMSLKMGLPEIRVVPNREKAAALGVDAASVDMVVQSAIGGLDIGTYKEAGRGYGIRVRLEEDARDAPETIGHLYARSRDGRMYARFLIDTELWDEASDWLAPDGVDMQIPHCYFARAFAAAKLGKLEKARDLVAKIRTGGNGNPEIVLSQKEVDILKLEVEAVIALAEGKGKKALELSGRATEMQKSLPFRYGPPRISKPAAELLGDVLSALGEYEQAALVYQDQLSRRQSRTNSLLGLARASALVGDDATSTKAYKALADIWHKADTSVQALTEVRDHVSANPVIRLRKTQDTPRFISRPAGAVHK